MMKDGNLWKEKREYLKESFSTTSGLMDFFIGTAVWGFLIVNYTSGIFSRIQSLVPIDGFLSIYISYLIFGVMTSILGLFISYAISKAYKFLWGRVK